MAENSTESSHKVSSGRFHIIYHQGRPLIAVQSDDAISFGIHEISFGVASDHVAEIHAAQREVYRTALRRIITFLDHTHPVVDPGRVKWIRAVVDDALKLAERVRGEMMVDFVMADAEYEAAARDMPEKLD